MDASSNNSVTQDFIGKEARWGARNYAPVPVVVDRARDCKVWDVEGRAYIDMMSAYSAVSFGHGHPRLLGALTQQAQRLAVTSRAYYNDRLPLFLQRLCEITGLDLAVPANTGVEVVFGSFGECVRSAIEERVVRDRSLWGDG